MCVLVCVGACDVEVGVIVKYVCIMMVRSSETSMGAFRNMSWCVVICCDIF